MLSRIYFKIAEILLRVFPRLQDVLEKNLFHQIALRAAEKTRPHEKPQREQEEEGFSGNQKHNAGNQGQQAHQNSGKGVADTENHGVFQRRFYGIFQICGHGQRINGGKDHCVRNQQQDNPNYKTQSIGGTLQQEIPVEACHQPHAQKKQPEDGCFLAAIMSEFDLPVRFLIRLPILYPAI